MNKKLNRMQFILIIASLFIMIANISLFTNDFVQNNVLKSIIGMVIPSILLFISFEVSNSLKLERSSRYITLMSMVSYFITIVGTYINLTKGMINSDGYLVIGSFNLNGYAPIALAAVIVPLIGYYLNKDSIYKKLIVVSTLYLAYFIINSIYMSLTFEFFGMTNSNGTLEFVTMSLIVLLYNLFLSNEYSKTLSITNFFYTLYVLEGIDMSMSTLVSSIAISAICIVAFLIRIRKEESKKYDTIPFVGIVLFLFALLLSYADYLLILPLGFVIITDMLIVVADLVKDKKEGLTYKIVLDLLTIIILIISITTGYHVIPMILMVLVSSLISTYALRGDYHEQYILPFKTVLCIIGLLVEINRYVEFDFILMILIINVFSIICSFMIDKKIFKTLFTIIAMISFIPIIEIHTLFELIVLISMIVFDYVILFIEEKNKGAFKNIYTIASIILLLINIRIFESNLIYLLFAVIFIIGHAYIKDRDLSLISFASFILFTINFIDGCGMDYQIANVIIDLVLFSGLFYLVQKIESINNISVKSVLLWALTIALYSELTLIAALVALAVNIIVLLIFMKENNMMFKSAVILTIVSILNILGQVDQVPTFVYMLVIGIIVVFIIIRSIKKYLEEPQDEDKAPSEVKYTGKKFCTNCGTEVSFDQKYCANCGNKINK